MAAGGSAVTWSAPRWGEWGLRNGYIANKQLHDVTYILEMDISQTSSYILESTYTWSLDQTCKQRLAYSELEILSVKIFTDGQYLRKWNSPQKNTSFQYCVCQNYSKLLPKLLTCLDSTICMELGWGCEEGLCLAVTPLACKDDNEEYNGAGCGARPANNTLEREEGWNILEVWQFGPSYN